MTRRQLLRGVGGMEEIQEWAAYQHIRGPLGPDGDDLRAGIQAAAFVTPYCKPGQGAAPIDFMPFVRRVKTSPQRMSNKQIAAIARQAQAGFAASAKQKQG